MELQILQKQLDESSHCPLCHASMYWIDAEQYTHELQFHECSHCQHRVFKSDSNLNCHCASCTAQRKKQTQQTRLQEQRKNKVKDEVIYSLDQLSFLNKLFLLSLLDQYAREDVQHDELIHWKNCKYHEITPNYLFQNHLVQELLKAGILKPQDSGIETEHYYLNVRLDGYADPSLFSITQQLRHWF